MEEFQGIEYTKIEPISSTLKSGGNKGNLSACHNYVLSGLFCPSLVCFTVTYHIMHLSTSLKQEKQR